MRSDFAGDVQPLLFGETDLIERTLGGEMRDVQAATGEFGDLYIAGDTNGLRAGGEGSVFGVLDDGEIEGAAIVHDLAREFCGGDGLAVVGNGDDACFAHGGDVSDIFAFAADAGGADRPDVDVAVNFGAIDDE